MSTLTLEIILLSLYVPGFSRQYQFEETYLKGAISRRRVLVQCCKAALVALYEAIGHVNKGLRSWQKESEPTTIYIWYNPPNRTDTDNCSRGFNQHAMKVMYHSHRSKDINIKHSFDRCNVGINGCHCIAQEILSRKLSQKLYSTHIFHCRSQVSTQHQLQA